MPATLDINGSTKKVIKHVREYVKSHHLQAVIHDELGRMDGDWLYLPVHVEAKDLFECVKRLQQIEDSWNDQEPRRLPRLMIVPTKD